MVTKVSIVEAYADASIEKKIEIILDNFNGFNSIIDGYEKCLSIQIRNEREYNRRKNNGDLGIRVQSSGISDTTARIAIENVTIQEAIKKGNYEEALKGVDDYAKHKREIQTLINMRDDYVIVSSQINLLQGEDLKIFQQYLSKEMKITDIAIEENRGYDALQKRLKRSRKIVKSQAMLQFTVSSGLHSVLERPFSEANGRSFLVKRLPLIVC